MQKEIKKYGDSHVLRLSPDDMKFNDLKEGDIIDFTITRVTTAKPRVITAKPRRKR